MKSILDPTFCYIPSTHTDIAKTFARVRREHRNATPAVSVVEADPVAEADQEACKDYLVLLRTDYRRAYLARLSGDPSSGNDYPRIRSYDSRSAL